MSAKPRDASPVNGGVDRRKKSGSHISRLVHHNTTGKLGDSNDATNDRKEPERRTSPLREQEISPTNTQLSTSAKRPSVRDLHDRGEGASDPLPRSESETRVSDVPSDEHTDPESVRLAQYEFKRVTFNMQQFKDTLMLILSPATKEDSLPWRNMMLAHHFFLPSSDLIAFFVRALRAQLDITSRPENRAVFQMRAVRFLKQALAAGMLEVNDATWVPSFQALLTNLSPLEKQIVVHPKPQDAQAKLGGTAVDSPLRRPVSKAEKKTRITFSDVSALDAAKLITLHEQQLLRSVPLFDCATLLPFMPGDKASLRPKLLGHRDEMIRWVATQIVASPDLKVRQVEVARWIEIAKHLRDLHNWNGASEVLEALASPPVTRLTQTWKGVKSRHRTLQKETIDAVQGTTWRKMIEETGSAVIPTLPMMLQVIDSAQTIAEADFPRALETSAEVLGVLSRVQTFTYPFEEATANCGAAFADALVTILTKMNLEQYSRMLEPSEDGGSNNKEGSNVKITVQPPSSAQPVEAAQAPEMKLAALMQKFAQKKSTLTMEEAKTFITEMNEASEADIAAAHARFGAEETKKGLFSSNATNTRLTFSRFVFFKKDAKARTWETVTETVRITNNTRGALVWKVELLCTSSPTGCRVSFLPSSGTIKKKDTLALQVQLVFTQPTTIQVLAVISCEGHGLYFLPLNCKGEPLTDPEREIPFNAVRTGEVIGSGAAGTVYKTTYNNQLVAVKRFRVDNIFDESSNWKEWKNEVLLMSKLKHPNVMGLIGVCTVYPNLCIVMEYLPLGSLQKVLHEKEVSLPWFLRLKFALDGAKGMAFLHTLNIWHRDMKSDNLLVSSLNPEEDTVKVTDFSISREQSTVTTVTMGVGLGTPHWKSPEVIKGEPFVARSDVYSYGIVMWEIFTREIPYAEVHYGHQIEAMVLEGKRPRFPTIKTSSEPQQSIQKEYVKLAEYCWDKIAERRPSFEDVVSTLFLSHQELRRRIAEEGGKETEESSNSASENSSELKTDNSGHTGTDSRPPESPDLLPRRVSHASSDSSLTAGAGAAHSSASPALPGSARLHVKCGTLEAKFRVSASSSFAALLVECRKKFKLAEIIEVELQDADGYTVLPSDVIGLVFPAYEKEEIGMRVAPLH